MIYFAFSLNMWVYDTQFPYCYMDFQFFFCCLMFHLQAIFNQSLILTFGFTLIFYIWITTVIISVHELLALHWIILDFWKNFFWTYTENCLEASYIILIWGVLGGVCVAVGSLDITIAANTSDCGSENVPNSLCAWLYLIFLQILLHERFKT